MRIFISNSAADQPNQTDDGTNFEPNDDNDPSWTLRVEGRLLDVRLVVDPIDSTAHFLSLFLSVYSP